MDLKLCCMIYELKGMVDTMSELAESDGNYENPVIDRMAKKMNEITNLIEEKSA
ncbi:hypothetical protein [Cytobacillus sp. Bac17]|uniref:hypothetical protein n=1 Tax=Cytobacillus sp. Bac17 TaxID=2926008 RepID=UPI002117E55B|nr:hypothetical protein [Cytobacillus sp. Bac17]